MRRIGIALVVGMVALWGLPAAAHEEHREQVLEEFDRDGDGRIDRQERATARDARRSERRAKRLERYDADGDGRLGAEERRQGRRERMESRRERCRGEGRLGRDHVGHLGGGARQESRMRRGGVTPRR